MNVHQERPVVVLDVDGTLVDSVYHHVCAWVAAFGEVGIEIPTHVIHSAIGMGGDLLVAHLAGQAAENSLGDHIRATHRRRFLDSVDQVRPTRGGDALVTSLRHGGYDVAVASSADADLTDRLLVIAGVDGQVSPVVTGDDVDLSKPHPEAVSAAIEGSRGTALAMVGDSPWDARAAARAGVPCVAVRTGGFSDQRLREAGAVGVWDDPMELVESWEAVLDVVGRSPTGGRPSAGRRSRPLGHSAMS